MPKTTEFARKFRAGLAPLIGRKLKITDGLAPGFATAAQCKLKLMIPTALREYYSVAGRLPLNKEHNRLYSPGRLKVLEGKLVFMEENQCMVFWGMDTAALGQDDPEVFQAHNKSLAVWYSEKLPFSDWIIKMWRWQRGLDPGQ